MSDSTYTIDGVTIEHQGGGFYDLTHESLAEPVRERGKENAEARAREIAAAVKPAEGDMEPQGEFDPQVRTVVENPEAPKRQERIPLPREYASTMSAKTKADFGRRGVKMVRIILEESEDIPPTGLFIGHNTRGYMIKPGEPVDVPEFLLNVLNDAVSSTPIVDSANNKVIGYRDRLKHPYRLLSSD